MDLREYRELIARAAGPRRERLVQIEAEMTALREEKQEIESILRKTDQLPAKSKKKTEPKGQTATAEEIENVRTWLEANPPNGEGVWASRLMEDAEFREATKVRSGVMTQVLAELHEQSFLTLSHMGRGGSRIYKVVV